MKVLIAVFAVLVLAGAMPNGHRHGKGHKHSSEEDMSMYEDALYRFESLMFHNHDWVECKILRYADYFEASGNMDMCDVVPAELKHSDNHEHDLINCMGASHGQEKCVCVKLHSYIVDNAKEMSMPMPESFNEQTGFKRVCGKCHDPCKLEWKPEMDKKERKELGKMIKGQMLSFDKLSEPESFGNEEKLKEAVNEVFDELLDADLPEPVDIFLKAAKTILGFDDEDDKDKEKVDKVVDAVAN